MKWYVFDQFDAFEEFNSAVAAAKYAEQMQVDDFRGIHIVLMSRRQLQCYCTGGDLTQALQTPVDFPKE